MTDQTVIKADNQQAEKELLEAARQDPQAFGGLYDHYVQQIYRYLLSKTRNEAEAQDLTAQTFMKAFESFAQYRHDGYFAAWLFRIARSKYVDFVRKGVTARKHERDLLEDPLPDPLEKALHQEKLAALKAEIARLPEKEQELLRLRYVAELPLAEIAKILGNSLNATKKKLYRLLAKLQNRLEVNYEQHI